LIWVKALSEWLCKFRKNYLGANHVVVE
jgi:hypothetical protein